MVNKLNAYELNAYMAYRTTHVPDTRFVQWTRWPILTAPAAAANPARRSTRRTITGLLSALVSPALQPVSGPTRLPRRPLIAPPTLSVPPSELPAKVAAELRACEAHPPPNVEPTLWQRHTAYGLGAGSVGIAVGARLLLGGRPWAS
jgi:hypothetical protein